MIRAALGIVLLVGSAVAAQPAPASERPWAAGVSESEQALALDLYTEGNAEFAESRFPQALAKYREALAHWDHPAIHFNMAVCLINLDQLLEAKQHLEKSLAFDAPGIGADAYAQALTYRKLLDGQLAFIKVSCRDPGADVRLDGRTIFIGPGTSDQVVLPGEHQIVATKPGLLTVSKTLVLVAGRHTTHDIRLVEVTSVTRQERRWPAWKPWAVLGGGVALAVLGGLAQYASASPRDASTDTMGDWESSRQAIAITLWGVGGAAAIAGVVGVILNIPRTTVSTLPVTPAVTPSDGGAVVSLGWSL
ncbi:MAG TPA: hypothetical protein VL326_37385 [Kofleriaceae bacterium]|nr:hypothetical protein [Kofleriaceae bacterium]